MKDNFYSYYDGLITDMQEQYPLLTGSTVFNNDPPSFPCLYFLQIDGSTALQTLSATEVGINLGVQIEVYSKESMAEARKISESVREWMIEHMFRCDYYSPIENAGDTSINRFVMRYEKLEV